MVVGVGVKCGRKEERGNAAKMGKKVLLKGPRS